MAPVSIEPDKEPPSKINTEGVEDLAKALYVNALERHDAYEVLKDAEYLLVSLECAYLGLEIALKWLITKNEGTFEKKHSIGYLVGLVEGMGDKNSDLSQLSQDLQVLLRDAPQRFKFWSPSHRYTLEDVSDEKIDSADEARNLTGKILKR